MIVSRRHWSRSLLDLSLTDKMGFLLKASTAGWDMPDVVKLRISLSQCRFFFDFDHTISKIDVIDDLIEHFAIDKHWRVLEQRWQSGEIGSEECLRGQFQSVRVSREKLKAYLSEIEIDPDFHRIFVLLKNAGVRPLIASDSFNFLIETILKNNDVHGIRILANRLRIVGDKLIPSFPYRNNACLHCANCKTSHLRNEDSLGKVLVYVGDGRSDFCASLSAHVVFAKDSLAEYLRDKRKKFVSYRNLKDVYDAWKGFTHE